MRSSCHFSFSLFSRWITFTDFHILNHSCRRPSLHLCRPRELMCTLLSWIREPYSPGCSPSPLVLTSLLSSSHSARHSVLSTRWHFLLGICAHVVSLCLCCGYLSEVCVHVHACELMPALVCVWRHQLFFELGSLTGLELSKYSLLITVSRDLLSLPLQCCDYNTHPLAFLI